MTLARTCVASGRRRQIKRSRLLFALLFESHRGCQKQIGIALELLAAPRLRSAAFRPLFRRRRWATLFGGSARGCCCRRCCSSILEPSARCRPSIESKGAAKYDARGAISRRRFGGRDFNYHHCAVEQFRASGRRVASSALVLLLLSVLSLLFFLSASLDCRPLAVGARPSDNGAPIAGAHFS